MAVEDASVIPPAKGAIVRGVNPRDPRAKPGRPAIVLDVRRDFALVIFGQSRRTGRGPMVPIDGSTYRLKSLATYFYFSEIARVRLVDLQIPEPQRLHCLIPEDAKRMFTMIRSARQQRRKRRADRRSWRRPRDAAPSTVAHSDAVSAAAPMGCPNTPFDA